MNIRDAEILYRDDAEFHALVDQMIRSIELLHFTPSDLRAAANFASILFEMKHPKPIMMNIRDIDPEFLRQMMQKEPK